MNGSVEGRFRAGAIAVGASLLCCAALNVARWSEWIRGLSQPGSVPFVWYEFPIERILLIGVALVAAALAVRGTRLGIGDVVLLLFALAATLLVTIDQVRFARSCILGAPVESAVPDEAWIVHNTVALSVFVRLLSMPSSAFRSAALPGVTVSAAFGTFCMVASRFGTWLPSERLSDLAFLGAVVIPVILRPDSARPLRRVVYLCVATGVLALLFSLPFRLDARAPFAWPWLSPNPNFAVQRNLPVAPVGARCEDDTAPRWPVYVSGSSLTFVGRSLGSEDEVRVVFAEMRTIMDADAGAPRLVVIADLESTPPHELLEAAASEVGRVQVLMRKTEEFPSHVLRLRTYERSCLCEVELSARASSQQTWGEAVAAGVKCLVLPQ